MTTPRYKLGSDDTNQLFRDISDIDQTVIKNNSLDIVKMSGITTANVIDILHDNPTIQLHSIDTSVTTAHSAVTLGISGGNNDWTISTGNIGLAVTDPEYNFHISKNGNEHLTILDGGLIGISENRPQFQLDIGGDTRTQGDFFISGNVFINGVTGFADVDNIWNVDGSNNVLSAAFSGNYGIGTTTPSSKLEVNGGIGISGNIVPLLDGEFDLGTTGFRFKDLFLSGNTIQIGDAQISASGADVSITNNLSVINNCTIGGTLTVSGGIDLNGDVQVNSIGVTTDANITSSLFVGTTATITGDLAVDSNTLYVDASANSVGIGTTTPTRSLDIVSSDSRPVRIETTSTSQNGILFINDTGTTGDQWQHRFDKVDTGATGSFIINHLQSGGDFWDCFFLNRTGTSTGDLTLGTVGDDCDLIVNGIANLATGNDYQINSVSVLNDTTLGSAIVNSSLTSNSGNLTNTGTINITTGNDYQINSVSVLNATTLGSAIVNSSLTNVGILTALTVSGNTSLLTMTATGAVQVSSFGVTNNLTVSTGDLTVSTGDLTVSTGEIFSSVCQTIGSLGYILLDEQSTIALSTTSFTGFVMDLDNQSTDDFAFYKILMKGIGHPTGGIMAIESRFQDLGGDIADTNGYQVDVNSIDGSSLIDTRATFMTLATFNAGGTGDRYYFCAFDMTLGSSASAQNMISGHFNISDVSGTPNHSGNVRCALTNTVTISTRITGLGLRMANVDSGQNREIFCRIIRML